MLREPLGRRAPQSKNNDMTANNKQLVSVRLNGSDLARIKRIAARMRVRDSDIIRFALKTTLMKLGPLHDEGLTGKDLLPVFIELGTELATYFDMDASDLEGIINNGVNDDAKRIERDDLKLLTMVGVPDHYLYVRLKSITTLPIEAIGTASALRQYLYSKYLRPTASAAPDEPSEDRRPTPRRETARAAQVQELPTAAVKPEGILRGVATTGPGARPQKGRGGQS